MYAITAIINRTGVNPSKAFPEGWEGSRNLPTFYLDERSQGITSAEHACRIARDIVLPFGETDTVTASITAVRVPGDDWREPDSGWHTVEVSDAERDYLARAVDVARSDEAASQILPPDERDTLLRKLGGRR